MFFEFTPRIRRRCEYRSDYIKGFIAPAIGPKKPRKLTQLIATAHNIGGKVWMENNVHGLTADNCLSRCGVRQIIKIKCVTYVQKGFKIGILSKQLLTKFQIFTKLHQISQVIELRNLSLGYL